MRWPWRPTADEAGDEDGRQARERAEQALQAARARRAEVEQIAARLRESRASNHFGESIAAAMRGRP